MTDIKNKLMQIVSWFISIASILMVLSIIISSHTPTHSETADVTVMVTNVEVSDELLIRYDIPIDKTYEAKPGWKFIIFNVGVINHANEIINYSNNRIVTKEDVNFKLFYIDPDNQNHIICVGDNSYTYSFVELKPDEVKTMNVAVQVPLNEDINDLYLKYTIHGDDYESSGYGRVKLTFWFDYIGAYMCRLFS